MNVQISDVPYVHQLSNTDTIMGVFGNEVGQMTVEEFSEHLNDNDEQVLHDLAFYMDINKASALGSARVDVGGNEHMRQLWEDAGLDVLMDDKGNYCLLNPDDCRYTVEGDYVLNADGTVKSEYAHGDFMHIRPQSYERIQDVTVGATTIQRTWESLSELPLSHILPRLVVGKFKASVVSGKMRSLPGMVPDNNKTINTFWNQAQARSLNHGLANLDFRNYLLYHMMSKYGWRDSQGCKNGDGTLVWGVGLDGSENTTSSASDGFTRQKNIKTGATLSLGRNDGKVTVKDSENGDCHSVNVAGFENPWGQYWEMVQGLCSVGATDVYCWRHNFMPTGTPTAETFAHVEHVLLQRATSTSATGMNIVSSVNGQGTYMIPKQTLSGVTYNDYFYYAAEGQLWLFGGSSYSGAACGLASAYSNAVWSHSSSDVSARLAYYGPINRVTAQRFRELAS